MSKHTPGPWHIKYYLDCQHIVSNEGLGRSVASNDRNDDEDDANAKLIAAAPDMLEALEVALGILGDEPHSDYPHCTPEDCAACQIEAAISKAHGVSHVNERQDRSA